MSKIEKYNRYFETAYIAKDRYFRRKKKYVEFYYSDVDGTMTQFDKPQLNAIQKTANIPISVKIGHPIIEQSLAFVMGSKPYPKLTSPSKNTDEFVTNMQGAYHSVWYESKTWKKIFAALRDMYTSGSGFIYLRNNDFYNETTCNVVIDHVSWRNVFVDPYSKREDLEDADYIILAEIMTIARAEREYDIKINDNCLTSVDFPEINHLSSGSKDIFSRLTFNKYQNKKEEDYCLVRRQFTKEDINVYISEDGFITTKKPVGIEIPNPTKEEFKNQLVLLNAKLNETKNIQGSLASQSTNYESTRQIGYSNENYANSSQYSQENVGMVQEGQEQIKSLESEIERISIAYNSEPDTIPAYKMSNDEGREVIALEVTRNRKKLVRQTIIINNDIHDEKIIKSSGKYPVTAFHYIHRGTPYDTLPMSHLIHDMEMALNKILSETIYEMQINNRRRIISPKGSIVEPSKIESSFAVPGSVTEYEPDPSLKDNGEPKVVEPSPMSQVTAFMLDWIVKMIEYITGIYPVLQGNSSDAPSTLGATNSLQNFGTQRIKMAAQNLESSFEHLAENVVAFIQAYAPRNKVLEYIDENGDQVEAIVLDQMEDLQFKVRVEMTSTLPTVKALAAQILSHIAQTVGDPEIATLLLQFSLEIMDLPQGTDWARQLDVVKRMKQQIVQLQDQVKQSQNYINSMQNNIMQRDIASKTALEAEKANTDIQVAKQEVITGINNNEEEY